MAVEILILSSARQRERLVLEGNELWVGTDPACDVFFNPERDPATKGCGALLRLEDDGWYSHVAYNALRMEPVFMALGQASAIAAHLAIEGSVAVRRVSTVQLQHLLVERGGVITCYSDWKFDDPSFAAFQWLGARGLNPGYKATATLKLTRRDGWTRLVRILRFEGETWSEPQDNPDGPLHGDDLAQWLRQAGYKPKDTVFKTTGEQKLDLSQFAKLTYRTLVAVRIP
jgi:hypothetical protein